MNDTTNLDKEYLEEKLLDRPISSLRDLQYTYGLISLSASASEVGVEKASYVTPTEVNDLIGEQNSLIVLKFDLTGEVDSYEGIDFTKYTKDKIEKIAYSRDNAGVSVDNSLAHLAGTGGNRDKVIKWAKALISGEVSRTTGWVNKDGVTEIEDEDENGEIISRLRELGSNHDILDDIKSDLESELGENVSQQPIITVKLKIDGEWKWPGEIPVIMKAMKRQKASSLIESSTYGRSTGTGVDMVTDETDKLVGFPNTPMSHYAVKQQDSFQGLNNTESSWLDHPISEETSLIIGKFNEYMSELHTNTFNQRIYYFPYPEGVITTKDDGGEAELLYKMLQYNKDSDENCIRTFIRYINNSKLSAENWSYYVVMLDYDQQSLWNHRYTIPKLNNLWLNEIAQNHNELLSSDLFKTINNDTVEDDIGIFSIYSPDNENEDEEEYDSSLISPLLINNIGQIAELIASGWYSKYDLSVRPNEDDTDYSETDFRAELHRTILQNSTISYERVIEESVKVLQAKDQSKDTFPSNTVKNQYIRILTLERSGIISSPRSKDTYPSMSLKKYMSQSNDEEDGNEESYVEQKQRHLSEFLEHSSMTDEERAVFGIGLLAGTVSDYQDSPPRNLSETLVSRHPVSRITTERLKEIYTESVDKSIVYDSEDGVSPIRWCISDVNNILNKVDLDNLSLSNSQLKFVYSIGVTFGKDVS